MELLSFWSLQINIFLCKLLVSELRVLNRSPKMLWCSCTPMLQSTVQYCFTKWGEELKKKSHDKQKVIPSSISWIPIV